MPGCVKQQKLMQRNKTKISCSLNRPPVKLIKRHSTHHEQYTMASLGGIHTKNQVSLLNMREVSMLRIKRALQNARDVYSRRNEATCIWVVPSEFIVSSTPEDMGSFFEPSNDKIYRHPNFYKTPGSKFRISIVNYTQELTSIYLSNTWMPIKINHSSIIALGWVMQSCSWTKIRRMVWPWAHSWRRYRAYQYISWSDRTGTCILHLCWGIGEQRKNRRWLCFLPWWKRILQLIDLRATQWRFRSNDGSSVLYSAFCYYFIPLLKRVQMPAWLH